MSQYWHNRKITFLFVLTLSGLVYNGWLQLFGTLTGIDQADGIIGVVFGLYICSHPAAFIVDSLFFRRSAFSSNRSLILWLVINILVLLAGWFVIFTGTTRLIGRVESIR